MNEFLKNILIVAGLLTITVFEGFFIYIYVLDQQTFIFTMLNGFILLAELNLFLYKLFSRKSSQALQNAVRIPIVILLFIPSAIVGDFYNGPLGIVLWLFTIYFYSKIRLRYAY